MSHWATAPKRTLLSDVNRSRWNVHRSQYENNPTSPGPAGYHPKHPGKRNNSNGAVTLRSRPGPTERDLHLPDGRDIRKISPVGPGAYDPPQSAIRVSDSPLKVQQQRRPFNVSAKRLESDARLQKERENSPGPGTYQIPGSIDTQRAVSVSRIRRDVIDPLPKMNDPSPDVEDLKEVLSSIHNPNRSLGSSWRNRRTEDDGGGGGGSPSMVEENEFGESFYNDAAYLSSSVSILSGVSSRRSNRSAVMGARTIKASPRKATSRGRGGTSSRSTGYGVAGLSDTISDAEDDAMSGTATSYALTARSSQGRQKSVTSRASSRNRRKDDKNGERGAILECPPIQLPRPLDMKGPSISPMPRHFNLHNPNSHVPRHKDSDSINPPPGYYTVSDKATSKCRSRSVKFATTPRIINLARKTCAPGPGAYNPIGRNIVPEAFMI